MTDEKKPTEAERLTREEARELLERLARGGPPSAQVAAIRVLLRLDREDEEAQREPPASPFDDLYDVPIDLDSRRPKGTAA